MSQFKFVPLEQGTPEWLAYRNGGIGASDIPTIIKCEGAYQTRESLMEQKAGRLQVEHSEYTQKIFSEGHQIEELVRVEAETQLGEKFIPCVVQSSGIPHFFASIDGMSSDGKRIIEVKSTKKKDFVSMVRSGECPPVYFYQIQWQLFITDLKECTLIVVDKETGDRIPLIVERDDDVICDLAVSAQIFFDELQALKGTPRTELVSDDQDALHLSQILMRIEVVSDELDQLDAIKKQLAEKLLKKYGANKLENKTFKIQTIEKVGAVNYKDIPELKGVNLDQYRGKTTNYIKVSLSKGETK